MASSIAPDFVVPGGCSHCSKIEMKEFPCPALAGRGGIYNSGLPVHPQFIHRSSCQCCPGSHQQICPSIPVRLDTFCNCPRCRRSQQGGTVDRRVPFPHHPQLVSCNSNWVHPVEVQNNGLANTGYIPPTLPTQPTVLGHVGMTSFAPLDNVPVNSISPLSYHHHHHYHHYHYHPHTRNTLHPYSLPFLHPRLRRQPNLRHTSRRNAEEEQLPHNIFSILTPGRVPWDTTLDAEQLESVVNFGEQLVDQKPRGLSKTVVENLPSYRIASKDKDIAETRCVICLMDFEEKHHVRILPCLHEYHTKCIDKWLKSNRTCPICRKEIKIS